MLEFEPFPKIGRLNTNVTITEKIDGTNAQIVFDRFGNMLVGSRKRQIYPEGTVFDAGSSKAFKGTDNFGFAKWAYDHQPALWEFLGEGRHYGEWAGSGIQRGYGMDTKRFFLFNVGRFGPGRQVIPNELLNIGLDSVPVLHEGLFNDNLIYNVMSTLKKTGSSVNGFVNPEGIIAYLHGPRMYLKETYEYKHGKWSDK